MCVCVCVCVCLCVCVCACVCVCDMQGIQPINHQAVTSQKLKSCSTEQCVCVCVCACVCVCVCVCVSDSRHSPMGHSHGGRSEGPIKVIPGEIAKSRVSS